jgi:hypothetical protein
MDQLERIKGIAYDVAKGDRDPKALASCVLILADEIKKLKQKEGTQRESRKSWWKIWKD